jgi:hypothetical protein
MAERRTCRPDGNGAVYVLPALCDILPNILAIAMHKAWPSLLKRVNATQTDMVADRELVIASRIWFCLYLFEHQYVIYPHYGDLS